MAAPQGLRAVRSGLLLLLLLATPVLLVTAQADALGEWIFCCNFKPSWCEAFVAVPSSCSGS